jgi:hypothetical protein
LGWTAWGISTNEIPRDAEGYQKWLEETADELDNRLQRAKSGLPEQDTYVDGDYTMTRIPPRDLASFEVDLDNEVFHSSSIPDSNERA